MTAVLPYSAFSAPRHDTAEATASAYNLAGHRYGQYADGDSHQLFAFEGRHAQSDRKCWIAIEGALDALRAQGKTDLRILDLGCGPGIWLRRTVIRARQMGFSSIEARGTDIAAAQLHRARAFARGLMAMEGVSLSFDLCDIRDRIAVDDHSVDLTLCLYGVLNHIPGAELKGVLAEIARVTAGRFIATVRTAGSTPTIYVDEVSAARNFHQDHLRGRLDVEFRNGRRASFDSHLFTRRELTALASPHFDILDVSGLDLFHSRFAGDPRWNPPGSTWLARLAQELGRLEERYCRDPGFIDHATHLLLVARSHAARQAL